MTDPTIIRAKIEALDMASKIIEDCDNGYGGFLVSEAVEDIESVRNRLTCELRVAERLAKPSSETRRLHADAETVMGEG